MKTREALLVVIFIFPCLTLLVACTELNPFAPTTYEIVHNVRVDPTETILSLGMEQVFHVWTERGDVEEIRFNITGVQIYDGQCVCNRTVQLGRLERLDPKTLIYRAPTEVRDVLLPKVITLYAGVGDVVGANAYSTPNYSDIAKIKIVP